MGHAKSIVTRLSSILSVRVWTVVRGCQFEQEPSNHGDQADGDEDGTGATALEKQACKVDLRNIKVERIRGTVPQGSLDLKAREFCEELDEQMDDAQALAGQVLDDEVKKAVFKMFLTGMARRWCRDWRAANPAASYADGAATRVHEFRPILLGVDVAERLKKERKR